MTRVLIVSLLFVGMTMTTWQNKVYAQGDTEVIGVSLSPLTALDVVSGNSSNWLTLAVDALMDVDGTEKYVGIRIGGILTSAKEEEEGLLSAVSIFGFRFGHRWFTGNHRGFFWGWHGVVDYRKLYWGYNMRDKVVLGIEDNPYHVVGATAGGQIGFRVGGEHMRVTGYLGAGLPLFYCFGKRMPAHNELMEFYGINALFRAIDIGITIDIFR